jgi:hypothetical protein
LTGKPEYKRSLNRPRCRREYTINIDEIWALRVRTGSMCLMKCTTARNLPVYVKGGLIRGKPGIADTGHGYI